MSSQKIITNTDILLSEVISNIMPATNSLDILVWFFYFSWFKSIHKNLWDKKIRIIIGMDAEIKIVNSVVKINEIDFITSTRSDAIKQLKEIFNKTDTLDNLEWVEAVEVYINKIIDWTLEIRKTVDPNHTKLYLFEHEWIYSHGWTLPWTVISWSSNLTEPWLSWRFEYNTIDRDPDNYKNAKEMFENIWNNHSISITTWWDHDELVKVLKQETWLKLTAPYLCYIRLLSEYFKDEEWVKTPADLTWEKFWNLEYQIDAIKKWLKILNEHNWVIIADVVWLWKSIIGSTLLWNLARNTETEKAIIICPPHLEDAWNDYKKDFNLKVEIFSSWKIEKALKYDQDDIHKAGVILIDEAHKYRNADTIDYWNLHQLCQWKKVILLSATPFNNEPNDIFNLIKLFQVPWNPTIHTKKWLMQDFKELQNKYFEIRKEEKEKNADDTISNTKLKQLSEDIRQIIWPVVVRRSRVDLEEIESYKKDLIHQWFEFSKVEDPRELKFDLWDIEDLYIDTLESLVEFDSEWKSINFIGARYKALTYIDKPKIEKYQSEIEDTLWYDYALLEWRQKNMPFFIRRLLVSRFESSIFAFKKTLDSIIWSYENIKIYLQVLDWIPVIKKWALPDVDDFFDEEWILAEEQVDKVKEYIKEKDWILIMKNDLDSKFMRDLDSDLEFLKWLQKDWGKIKNDPKLDSFSVKLNELQKENIDRKIVVFSMFADTIDYLKSNLSGRVLVVTWKQKTESLKLDIKLNFDAWVNISKQKNDYDILLWTDAISEWYNLHRAWIIINYDIPYNPTKVIQRIWRINRINKKVFDTLYVYNYFPSLVWEDYVNTKRISKLKIKMIATVLWIDVKTLTGEEEVGSFYKKVIEQDKNTYEDKSWDSEYLNDYKKAIQNKELLQKIENIPQRTKIMRIENKWVSWVLLFAKKRTNLIFYFLDEKKEEVIALSIKEAFELFKSEQKEEAKEVSKTFYLNYEKLKEEIKKPWSKANMNTQQKKAFEIANNMFEMTWDNYYKLLKDVIELGSLPLVYMKKIRKVTKLTWEKEVKKIKELITEEYLKWIVDFSKNFNEEMLDLIISEEFN